MSLLATGRGGKNGSVLTMNKSLLRDDEFRAWLESKGFISGLVLTLGSKGAIRDLRSQYLAEKKLEVKA